ncbi:MAG: restriction endonuclease [Planctomycetota bacterium]|nr:MAG: restriction endonuclease [Planctomycetota bacterium]
MALWLTRSGRHCEYETKFLDEGRIYLTFRELDQDLSTRQSRQEVFDLMQSCNPNAPEASNRQFSSQVWSFVGRMAPGDWVAMPSKRKTIHLGEITGGYEFVPGAQSPYYHFRTVRWLETDIPRTNFDQDILLSLGAFTTICQIKRNEAEQRVRAMQDSQWRAVAPALVLPGDEGEDGTLDEAAADDIDLEQIATDQIARLIYSKYAGHGMELLVEAILQAKGFTTYHSEKGPDGGIDILAAPDTLGFGHPRICVQVKSQASPLERPVLDQLVGTMQHVGADQGLLVCWGGFKSSVKKELPRLFFKVRLWDQSELIEQFLSAYDRLDDDLRAELPLKRMWAVTSQSG